MDFSLVEDPGHSHTPFRGSVYACACGMCPRVIKEKGFLVGMTAWCQRRLLDDL